jgi:hypothetical protein
MVQKLLKDNGLVVFGVFYAVEKSGGTLGDGLLQEGQLRAVMFQFGLISSFELEPLCGIVCEPLTELVAGRNLFQPNIDAGLFLGEPAGPEAVDEDTCAVGCGGCFIYALELDGHG